MKQKNMQILEKLSLFCHLCGLFTVFIGLVIAFIDLLNSGFKHIQVGLYVFFTGYALVKISTKMSEILADEKTPPPGQSQAL